MCTDEAKTQVGCRSEYQVSPSSAYLCESVPPSFTVPFLPCYEMELVVPVSIEDGRSVEIKYVKKGIIVEDVD
jgi:hypothetical protein